jgi:ubiquitin-conjugating enzyme E2 D/E
MNSQLIIKRIQNEIKNIRSDTNMNKMYEIQTIGDDMFNYDVILNGPEDSLYAGYKFKLKMTIPVNYPLSAPNIKFITKIQHLNVNENGDICLDVLKDGWKPIMSINSVILSIIALLSDPGTEDPLNFELANLYKTNRDQYFKTIKQSLVHTKN